MRTFLRTHTNAILVFLAVFFLALIVVYFSWEISYLFFEINQANTDKNGTATVQSFNLQGAVALDYRGIQPGQVPVTVATTTEIIASTTATTTTP